MDKLARWALKRAYGPADDAGEVRLLAVDSEGRVRDLGAYAVTELGGIVWAVGVAYRHTPVRWEKTRLAGYKGAARRLAAGVTAISKK